MFKRSALIILAVILLSVNVSIAFADTQEVTITYNDIQIYINGVLTSFTDEYGMSVEPFIYNGKVYIPLNSVADALSMSYAWDGSSMSAYLGVAQDENELLVEVCPPYEVSSYVDEFASSDGTSFTMAGSSYTNGYTICGNKRYALFNLNGAYSSMSFIVGHIDGTTMEDAVLQIFLDGVLSQEIVVTAEGLPQEVTVVLNNALSMKWFVSDGNGNVSWAYVGIGEITIQ